MPTHEATRVGCAGWALRREFAQSFPGTGSHLTRYAARLNAVEINSSFKSNHMRRTYERWAGSVGDDFKFSVKMPKRISHDLRLANCRTELTDFLIAVGGLGDKLGPLLLQLPPSAAFDDDIVSRFFRDVRALTSHEVVIEPRHDSWFGTAAVRTCREFRVEWVEADPQPHCGTPPSSRYLRLHGTPRMYYSLYSDEFIASLSRRMRQGADGSDVWCIFDNTAAGHAWTNALALTSMLP